MIGSDPAHRRVVEQMAAADTRMAWVEADPGDVAAVGDPGETVRPRVGDPLGVEDEHERAVVEPEARRVLSRFDGRSAHYELVAGTGTIP